MFMLMLLTFLDFQRPVTDQKFVVLEIVESALTGCATNPQGGGFGNDPLTIEWGDQSAESVTEMPLSLSFGNDNEPGGLQPMVVTLPGNNSPPPPPIPVTPEPPTYAILGITAAVLIYLLFGYDRKPSHYF